VPLRADWCVVRPGRFGSAVDLVMVIAGGTVGPGVVILGSKGGRDEQAAPGPLESLAELWGFCGARRSS